MVLSAIGATPSTDFPFLEASTLVSDDLCLLTEKDGVYRLRAACLCAPTFWSLRDMLDRPLGGLHEAVPGGDPELASRISRIFHGLQRDTILERFNWTVQLDGERYTPSSQPMKEELATISPEEAAQRLYLRVERQTIRKVTNSSSVLFTIRISTDPLKQVLANHDLRLTFARNWAATDETLAEYKGWPHYQPAVDWFLQQN